MKLYTVVHHQKDDATIGYESIVMPFVYVYRSLEDAQKACLEVAADDAADDDAAADSELVWEEKNGTWVGTPADDELQEFVVSEVTIWD